MKVFRSAGSSPPQPLPAQSSRESKRKGSFLRIRTFFISGWRGLSSTLLSTGTTVEGTRRPTLVVPFSQSVPMACVLSRAASAAVEEA